MDRHTDNWCCPPAARLVESVEHTCDYSGFCGRRREVIPVECRGQAYLRPETAQVRGAAAR
jgi:hypothetical protein